MDWNALNKECISPHLARVLYHNLSFDLQSYLDLAAEFGDPVLELGAGLGRVSQTLLRHNFRVTALEYFQEYCEEMQHMRHHLPQNQRENFTIVCDDMTQWSSGENFGLIILPLRTVNLLSDDERAICFQRAFQHLHADGAFALHLASFVPEQATQLWKQVQEFKTDLGWLEIDEQLSFDQIQQVYQLRHRVYQFNSQAQQIGCWRIAHNLLSLDIIDIQQDLAEAGFESIRIEDLGKDKLIIATRT